jgi:hypothetical protein
MNRHLTLLVGAGLILSSSVALAAPHKATKATKAKRKPAIVAPVVEETAPADPVEATPQSAPANPPSNAMAAPGAKSKKASAPAPAPEKEEPAARPAESAGAEAAAPEGDDKPERRITVAAMGGIGFNETKLKLEGGNESKDGVSAHGAGIGLRGGYTLPMKVYIGAAFVYHLGGTKEVEQVKYSGSTLYLGVEGGYDLALGPVVVRPYLGLGYGTAKAKAEVGGRALVDESEGGLAVWPGVMARYQFTDMLFVGADARYAVITGTDKITNANGFGMFALVGAAF